MIYSKEYTKPQPKRVTHNFRKDEKALGPLAATYIGDEKS